MIKDFLMNQLVPGPTVLRRTYLAFCPNCECQTTSHEQNNRFVVCTTCQEKSCWYRFKKQVKITCIEIQFSFMSFLDTQIVDEHCFQTNHNEDFTNNLQFIVVRQMANIFREHISIYRNIVVLAKNTSKNIVCSFVVHTWFSLIRRELFYHRDTQYV